MVVLWATKAPPIMEAAREGFPAFVIDTGQHHDELLGHGIKEFGMEELVACNLQIRENTNGEGKRITIKFRAFWKNLEWCSSRQPHTPSYTRRYVGSRHKSSVLAIWARSESGSE